MLKIKISYSEDNVNSFKFCNYPKAPKDDISEIAFQLM